MHRLRNLDLSRYEFYCLLCTVRLSYSVHLRHLDEVVVLPGCWRPSDAPGPMGGCRLISRHHHAVLHQLDPCRRVAFLVVQRDLDRRFTHRLCDDPAQRYRLPTIIDRSCAWLLCDACTPHLNYANRRSF